jgi:hypothetical protein
MKDEYIIINKTAIQKRIEELKFQREREPDNNTQSFLNGKIKQLKQILSQSTPLIPENINKILSTPLGKECANFLGVNKCMISKYLKHGVQNKKYNIMYKKDYLKQE